MHVGTRLSVWIDLILAECKHVLLFSTCWICVWFLTLSSALSRIWLSGIAPSRLSQRSSTRSFSSSSSLTGSTREPRAWPQLWESYKHTPNSYNTPEQKTLCKYHLSDIISHIKVNIYCKIVSHFDYKCVFCWVMNQEMKSFIPLWRSRAIDNLVGEIWFLCESLIVLITPV